MHAVATRTGLRKAHTSLGQRLTILVNGAVKYATHDAWPLSVLPAAKGKVAIQLQLGGIGSCSSSKVTWRFMHRRSMLGAKQASCHMDVCMASASTNSCKYLSRTAA